jgi:hypothetical protein
MKTSGSTETVLAYGKVEVIWDKYRRYFYEIISLRLSEDPKRNPFQYGWGSFLWDMTLRLLVIGSHPSERT